MRSCPHFIGALRPVQTVQHVACNNVGWCCMQHVAPFGQAYGVIQLSQPSWRTCCCFEDIATRPVSCTRSAVRTTAVAAPKLAARSGTPGTRSLGEAEAVKCWWPWPTGARSTKSWPLLWACAEPVWRWSPWALAGATPWSSCAKLPAPAARCSRPVSELLGR